MESMYCVICDDFFVYPADDRYNQCTCPQCGQFFEYDENLIIKLSDEQINILKYKFKAAKELVLMYQMEIRNEPSIKKGFCEGTLFRDRLEILDIG